VHFDGARVPAANMIGRPGEGWALAMTIVSDGISHGPEGSVDKLLMTAAEQAVGHAALALGGAPHGSGDDTWLSVYLYSRAQSVMGGTSQIQRNLVATCVLGLPSA
jgi:alkylation response protein AidB-like acyl-CoA dehydrogenase